MDDAPDLTDAVPMQSFLRQRRPEPDPELEEIGARGRARRPGDAHLHLGHHRHAQGRHADARQPRLQPERLARHVRRGQRRPLRFVPAAVARHRAASGLRHDVLGRSARLLSESSTTCRARWPKCIPRSSWPCRACTRRSTTQVAAQDAGSKAQASQLGASPWDAPTAKRSFAEKLRLPCPGSWPTSWSFRRCAHGMGGRARIFVSGGAPLGTRDRHLVRRHRNSHPRRLRPDRNLAGHRAEQSHQSSHRHGGQDRCRTWK